MYLRALGGEKIFQRYRQLNVSVRYSIFFAQGLEFFDNCFGQIALKIGVAFAGENPAAGEAIGVNGALAVNLITAPAELVIPSAAKSRPRGAKRSRGICFNRFLRCATLCVAPVGMTIKLFNRALEIHYLRRCNKKFMAEFLEIAAVAASGAISFRVAVI